MIFSRCRKIYFVHPLELQMHKILNIHRKTRKFRKNDHLRQIPKADKFRYKQL